MYFKNITLIEMLCVSIACPWAMQEAEVWVLHKPLRDCKVKSIDFSQKGILLISIPFCVTLLEHRLEKILMCMLIINIFSCFSIVILHNVKFMSWMSTDTIGLILYKRAISKNNTSIFSSKIHVTLFA